MIEFLRGQYAMLSELLKENIITQEIYTIKLKQLLYVLHKEGLTLENLYE